jgi:hypothetical protein
VGRFVQREPAEVPQFHDTTLSRVEFRQTVQQVVQSNDVQVGLRGKQCGAIELHAHPAAGAFPHLSPPGVVDEDPAHHLGRQREELRPVLPRQSSLLDESKIRFVNERGRLQRVARFFSSEVCTGAPAQIPVHQRDKALARGIVASGPGSKQGCHIEV